VTYKGWGEQIVLRAADGACRNGSRPAASLDVTVGKVVFNQRRPAGRLK